MVAHTLAVRSLAAICLAPEIRCIVVCGGEFWTLWKVYEKYLECYEMWHKRRMERASWTDRMRKEGVLQKVVQTMNRKKLIVLVTS
jgi:hypothetical protein